MCIKKIRWLKNFQHLVFGYNAMKLKVLFLITVIAVWYVQTHSFYTPQLQRLLNDMKLYKLDAQGEKYLHGGDLYEHSVWTYNAAWEILADSSPYTQGFSLAQRQKEVVALAALLHDVGKAGRIDLFEKTHPTLHYDVIKNKEGNVDHIVYFVDHQAHPHIGFEYTGKQFFAPDNQHFVPQQYYVINQKTAQLELFDFERLFDELGLTQKEQKVVAILIGIHYEFGNLKHAQITIEQFLGLIEDLVKAVEYNHGELDELIVRLSILIQVIDVKGLIQIPARSSKLFPNGIQSDPTHFDLKFEDPFVSLGYATTDHTEPFALKLMFDVLDTFSKQQETNNALDAEYATA